MTSITDLTLIEVASAIRHGEVSSVEATSACLDRIAAVDPKVNAVIATVADRAMDQARQADRARANGGRNGGSALGPLHGVPLAHKDMFYRAGEISTCGSLIRRDWVADSTASVLRALDSAGAVTLARLGMSEFAIGPIGLNHHNGAVRNPWNPDHVTGGSSSGPGAAVASRMCFGALGSDTGASIRVPAAACGLVGLKPTRGLISTAGAMPLSFTLDVVGPLARTVRDAALMTAVLAAPDDSDMTAPHPAFLALAGGHEPSTTGLRIGIPDSYFLEKSHGDVQQAFETARSVFASLGFECVSVPGAPFAEAAGLYGDIFGHEAASFHRRWLDTRPDDYSPQVRARLMGGREVSRNAYIRALDQRKELLDRVTCDVFGKADLVLAPVLAAPVPTIAEADVGDSPAMKEVVGAFLSLTQPANVLGIPALALPAGFTTNGLPTGVQLMGLPWSEDLLLAAGIAYEREVAPYPRPAITTD